MSAPAVRVGSVTLDLPSNCDWCGADLDRGEAAHLIYDPATGFEHYLACGRSCSRHLLATFTEEADNVAP